MIHGWLLATAAAVLSLERLTYVYVARRPERFRWACRHPAVTRLGEPVAVVRTLVALFKALQVATFVIWCVVHGDGRLWPAEADPVVLGLAAAAVAGGQFLNWSVFRRLGAVGVFYGGRLGHDVPWCHGFPFSLCAHPQYVGAVLTIWGFFFGMRFPRDDWFVLPALETLYYAAGARLEREPHLSSASQGAPLGERRT